MARIYFHIDLNAFFANAEILRDPSLKGKPIAVSGKTRRSVVSTASYEARKFGVHSAMSISEAQKLCPGLIIVDSHYSWYSELSRQFMDIVKSYTEELEQASIDECYADVTEVIMRYQRPLDLAWEIQRRILSETKLPCSIGVGPNMFLAKMASDMKKPMGITVLRIRDIQEKMWPLPIGEMRGVGRKTIPLLDEIGIKTIGDLAKVSNLETIRPVFGKNTEEIHRKANGYDDRVIVKDWNAKSMGVSETLLEDITDYEEIRGILRRLARKLSIRLHEERKAGYKVAVRICYYDFRNIDRSIRLDHPVWRADDLFVSAMTIFDANYDEEDAIRLLGVSVDDFADDRYLTKQLNLFDLQTAQKEETNEVIMDLNHLLGSKAFVRASDIVKE